MRIVVFGDSYGLPLLQRYLPKNSIVAVVGAVIRPQYFQFIRHFAESLDVPYIIQPKYSEGTYPKFVESINKLSPDYIIVSSYALKVQKDIISIPNKGAINIHGGLLPQYRGCNPIQWAIINNQNIAGVTMHYMDDDFDTGDIIGQRQFPIYFEDTWVEVRDRLTEATKKLLQEELPALFAGNSSRHRQDESSAHYCPRRHPEDGLIHWQTRVLDIYNLVRALVKPHPGAFYHRDGKKYILDEYLTIPQITALKYTVGGMELKTSAVTLKPVTNENAFVLYDLLQAGKKRGDNRGKGLLNMTGMSPADFLSQLEQVNDTVLFENCFGSKNVCAGFSGLININFQLKSAQRIYINNDELNKSEWYMDIVQLNELYGINELGLQNIY